MLRDSKEECLFNDEGTSHNIHADILQNSPGGNWSIWFGL